MSDNAYSPMTANEAGEVDARIKAMLEVTPGEVPIADILERPKPCTEGGDHCFCVDDGTVVRCCWDDSRNPAHQPSDSRSCLIFDS